jgi:hypothetical protein
MNTHPLAILDDEIAKTIQQPSPYQNAKMIHEKTIN